MTRIDVPGIFLPPCCVQLFGRFALSSSRYRVDPDSLGSRIARYLDRVRQGTAGRAARLQLDDAATDGDCERLGAIARAKLFHNVLDMDLDGLFGNEEALRNIPIPISARDVTQHVDFAPGQTLVCEMR